MLVHCGGHQHRAELVHCIVSTGGLQHRAVLVHCGGGHQHRAVLVHSGVYWWAPTQDCVGALRWLASALAVLVHWCVLVGSNTGLCWCTVVVGITTGLCWCTVVVGTNTGLCWCPVVVGTNKGLRWCTVLVVSSQSKANSCRRDTETVLKIRLYLRLQS